MRRLWWTLPVVGAAATAWWWLTPPEVEAPAWRTAEVEQKDVRALVTSTGTIQPVTQVLVGTQVTGIVAELLVDFNDAVTAGQIVARLDTSLLQSDAAAAEAQVASAVTQRDRAAAAVVRADALRAANAETPEAVELARADLAVAESTLRVARVALDKARRAVALATIASPIDGTVVRRSVEVGQTVNAGLSAPELFLIAGDLSQIQVLANVDEADIGRVHAGATATFTVSAWPGASFAGVVREVRLQSTVVENVVTYAVVVDAENPDRKLLPGMTATVDFVAEEAKDALCVPSAALRFTPEATAIRPGGEAPASEAPAGPPTRGRRKQDAAILWTPGDDGLLAAVPVKVGVSDGVCTAVTGEGLSVAQRVVTGIDRSAEETSGGNPFAPQTGAPASGGWRRPGSF